MNLREEMRIKGMVGDNEFMMTEMAAAHLVKVIILIKDGKIEQAAKEYLDAGGVPGGVTRTVNHYIKNNPDQDNANFEKFREHFANLRKTKAPEKDAEGNVKKRKYTKKTAEGGKQGQQAAKKRLEGKIVKQYHINKEFIDNIKAKSDEELQKKAKEIIEDLTIGKLYDEDKETVATLKAFQKDGSKRGEAIKAMVSLLRKGLISVRDFGLWAEKPEAFITSKSKARAEERREKIKDKEDERKK
jgi:hypothetical protein